MNLGNTVVTVLRISEHGIVGISGKYIFGFELHERDLKKFNYSHFPATAREN